MDRYQRVRAAKARANALSAERRSAIATVAAKARWAENQPEVRTQDQLIFYANAQGAQVGLRFDGQTMWATQRQIAEIFDVAVSGISRHLSRIFEEGELLETAVVTSAAIPASDGKLYETKLYELEAIISLGMRVSSKKGTHFRIWSRGILRDYMIKGVVIDDERLRTPEGRPDFFEELLTRIRDIRIQKAR